MPAIDIQNVYAETRDILTGDPTSHKPTDAQLSRKASDVLRRLFLRYPCLGTQEAVAIPAAQIPSLERAAGAMVAVEVLNTPLGDRLTGNRDTRVGPVRSVRQGRSATEIRDSAWDTARRSLSSIACIGSGAPGLTMIGRSGRTVVEPRPASAVNQAFGPPGPVDDDDPDWGAS